MRCQRPIVDAVGTVAASRLAAWQADWRDVGSWKPRDCNWRQERMESTHVSVAPVASLLLACEHLPNAPSGARKGILEFDYESQAPQHVFTQHYRLDLSKATDRSIAHDLRVRASIVPGDNWWNERIDGVPFSLPEDFAAPRDDALPRRGILELDYVVTRPQETAKSMVTDHFELDLSDAKVCAAAGVGVRVRDIRCCRCSGSGACF